MTIKILPGYDRPKEVGTLFAEYTEMLLKGDPSFGKYLEIQNYEEELKHLEAKYGLPEGRLYLAYQEDRLAGCIGLRKIDAKSCEMKRLYVRPAYRGSQIGSRLVQKILADAEEIGYRCMLLDTHFLFCRMQSACTGNTVFMRFPDIIIIPWIPAST